MYSCWCLFSQPDVKILVIAIGARLFGFYIIFMVLALKDWCIVWILNLFLGSTQTLLITYTLKVMDSRDSLLQTDPLLWDIVVSK